MKLTMPSFTVNATELYTPIEDIDGIAHAIIYPFKLNLAPNI